MRSEISRTNLRQWAGIAAEVDADAGLPPAGDAAAMAMDAIVTETDADPIAVARRLARCPRLVRMMGRAYVRAYDAAEARYEETDRRAMAAECASLGAL